jgi:hypothetical protein
MDIKEFYNNHKELIDQSAHVSYCALLSFLVMVGRLELWAAPIAIVIPYAFAMLREWYQHNRLIWLNKDLAFSMGGVALGIIISFIVGI